MPTIIARAWILTISNPKIPCDAYLNQWFADGNIVFGCGQYEKGEKGLLHHQIYIVTKKNDNNKNGFTLKWMKENIHSTAHFEKRNGTHEQAVAYCTKEETRMAGPFTVGEWSDKAGPAAGGKVNGTKILAIKRKIDEGATDEELWTSNFGEMLRYSKGFERYKLALKSRKRDWQTKSLVLWGPPGTGKSMRARKVARTHFAEDDIYYLALEGETVWMDGYNGHKCVIIEEFYGQIKINILLKMLDRYPLTMQTKGGFVNFAPEMVIFTSNEHPRMWYGKGAEPGAPSKIPLDVLNALARRFEGTCGAVVEMKELVSFKNDEPTFQSVVEEMIRVAEQPVMETSAPQSIDLTADDSDVIDESSKECDHDPDYVCGDCCDEAMEDVTPAFKKPKLERTDSQQREWLIEPPAVLPGRVKKSGPGPVQTTLNIAQRRRISNDDDDDVDDK